MLFNSYSFILFFLPFSLLVYHGLRSQNCERSSILALTLLSLLFYGWWNPIYLLLLIPLTLANFMIARLIMNYRHRPKAARALLIMGLVGNLSVLGYFKYANFFIDNLNVLFGLQLFLAHVVLPLGISFFTFQKIAFLVDAYRGKVDRLNLLDFSLFVSFFPQLIAGPIVHHSEVLPQFRRTGPIPSTYIPLGLTIFTIGLAKKVLLADTAALYASPAFSAAASGNALSFMSAWSVAFAYTAQLYFDFSGYSDMAIGAALLFGIRLPVNFNSPYKAINIIDFWRRWHITLSRFLRDYLYIPLGGNRHGKVQRYRNLLITMLLGGLWHGANWTFVIWGGLHGIFLIINHVWQAMYPPLQQKEIVRAFFGWGMTFLAVVMAWVFFRADNVATALSIVQSMVGGNEWDASYTAVSFLPIALLLVAFLAPNTQELAGYIGPDGAYRPSVVVQSRLHWQPTLRWAAVLGCLFALAFASLSHLSEFIYFQF